MFGFSIRTRQNSMGASPRSVGSPGSVGSPITSGTPRGGTGSPRTDQVGEIDTRAPFQSVKAAVSLFGEASPRTKPSASIHRRTKSGDDRVLEKESHLHLALRELDHYRERLRSTEAIKAQAYRELEKAKRTLQELTNRLEAISESKQAAIEATEAAKKRAQELEAQLSDTSQAGGDAWKLRVDREREQYKASAAELISAKQELNSLRQDFDAALEAKLTAFQEAEDAQHTAKVNKERVCELSEEIINLRKSLSQVKIASLHAQEELGRQRAQKDAHLQSLVKSKEEVDEKIKSLKEESDPALVRSLEEKNEETTEAIAVLQEQLVDMKSSDIAALESADSELDAAKKELQGIVAERDSLQGLVEPLKLELETVKSQLLELQAKAIQAESDVESLQGDIEKSKAEVIEAEARARQFSEETHISIEQLSAEAKTASQEAEQLKKEAELYNREAENARNAAKEAEEKLSIAMKEVIEAKEAEKLASVRIHNSSADTTATDGSSGGKIKLSVEEFEALTKKIEDSRNDADMKVATALAQVESIRAKEKEVLANLEASVKESEETKTCIEDAMKRAEMADAAKQVIEGELRKRRQKESDDEIGESSHVQEEMGLKALLRAHN